MTPDIPIRYTRPKAAELLGVSTFILFQWEKLFPQLNPETTPGGHKYYTEDDLEICRQILYLRKEKGISLSKAVKAMGNYRKEPPRRDYKCETSRDAVRLLNEVSDRTDDPHAAARLKAVKGWIEKNENKEN